MSISSTDLATCSIGSLNTVGCASEGITPHTLSHRTLTTSDGYKQCTEVMNLLTFDFTGVVMRAGINYNGSSYGLKVAASSVFYTPSLAESTLRGFAVLDDSAFQRLT